MPKDFSNHKQKRFKTPSLALGVIVILAGFWAMWSHASNDAPQWTENLTPKNITLAINGLNFFIPVTQAKTINDFLKEQKVSIAADDLVYPKGDITVRPNTTVYIYTAKSVSLVDGTKKSTLLTHGQTLSDAFRENNIELNDLDDVTPKISSVIDSSIKQVVITRVVKETQTKEETIPFETKATEDDNLSWRTKKIVTKGEKGSKQVTYEVLFKNGKEVGRKITNTTISKSPVTEEIVQGTFMKLKKANTGWGTWYTQPKNMVHSYPQENGMTAASPWIPIGNYVKVTNKETGKSVVVRINDRGPFGANRIIDLNTPAFAKIASLGAGVIDVKVEEILN